MQQYKKHKVDHIFFLYEEKEDTTAKRWKPTVEGSNRPTSTCVVMSSNPIQVPSREYLARTILISVLNVNCISISVLSRTSSASSSYSSHGRVTPHPTCKGRRGSTLRAIQGGSVIFWLYMLLLYSVWNYLRNVYLAWVSGHNTASTHGESVRCSLWELVCGHNMSNFLSKISQGSNENVPEYLNIQFLQVVPCVVSSFAIHLRPRPSEQSML